MGGNIIWVRTLDLNQPFTQIAGQLEKSQRIIWGKCNGTECRFHNKEVEQMQYFKLQIGCMLIVLYVAFIYIREKYEYKVKQKEPVFELLLITGILSIVFDGATAYTVNYLDKVPGLVNDVLHACFLCGLDTLSFVIFYICTI